MAIWQISFSIIPNEIELQHQLVNKEKENVVETMSWKGHTIKDSSIKELSKVLKPNKSWSDDIKLFGSTEQTCIELFYEDTILDEVSIRLDLRNLTPDVLEAVINFIKLNNAVILTSNGSIIETEFQKIIKEIRESKAYSFLSNPEVFFNQVKENNNS